MNFKINYHFFLKRFECFLSLFLAINIATMPMALAQEKTSSFTSYDEYLAAHQLYRELQTQFFSQEAADQIGKSMYAAALNFIDSDRGCIQSRRSTCSKHFSVVKNVLKRQLRIHREILKEANPDVVKALVHNLFREGIISMGNFAKDNSNSNEASQLVADWFMTENYEGLQSFLEVYNEYQESPKYGKLLGWGVLALISIPVIIFGGVFGLAFLIDGVALGAAGSSLAAIGAIGTLRLAQINLEEYNQTLEERPLTENEYNQIINKISSDDQTIYLELP